MEPQEAGLGRERRMINGAHVVLYSRDAEGDRAFIRDVLGWKHVDAGGGWLIFALPPSEVAVHPTDGHPGVDAGSATGTPTELYLMCDDVEAQRKSLVDRGVECSDLRDEGWGILTSLTLPGGTELGLYQPRHPTAF